MNVSKRSRSLKEGYIEEEDGGYGRRSRVFE
jgi:hypothetical protein